MSIKLPSRYVVKIFSAYIVQMSDSGSEMEGNDAREKELRERALSSLKKAKKAH